MVARLSIDSNVDLALADRLTTWMQGDGARVFERLPGYHGSMPLVDRDNAQIVGIGFYDSAGQLAESEAGTFEVAHRD
jgi:predicted RNA-binding protein (virulence factor B family)